MRRAFVFQNINPASFFFHSFHRFSAKKQESKPLILGYHFLSSAGDGLRMSIMDMKHGLTSSPLAPL